MKRHLASLLVLTAACSPASPPATSEPSAARSTAELDTLLRTAVAERRVPHVVAMVATKDGVGYERAEGVGLDAIFGIASMTKPVTTIAAMQLVEAGKIRLDEPIAPGTRAVERLRGI